MSEAKLYGQPKHVVFLHESNFGKFHINNMNPALWKKSSYSLEFDFVRDEYFPFLLKNRGDKQTLLDLGHHNLYFMDALLNYLDKETKVRYLIVRIRRERLEAALSLTFNTPSQQYLDLCAHLGLIYRYCPFDRVDDVVLHPPSKEVWGNFTVYQQVHIATLMHFKKSAACRLLALISCNVDM